MEQRAAKLPSIDASRSAETVLEERYEQLLSWGRVLTRGDVARTEEIVHDLCLHLCLSRPDLAAVANLDGYLYTSLRHIYLSSLSRAYREAGRFVGVAEFDSLELALAFESPRDVAERQNDLRRVCTYSVWRKQDSKASSYFILHFFHGYTRNEIAQLAILPLSAIYNKLKIAREEAISYLTEPEKLRFTRRSTPPKTKLQTGAVSSPELFRELRATILAARTSDCLPEEELLGYYRAGHPLPCELLSHIVSCENCLDIIDRHFQRPALADREPVDGFGSSSDRKTGAASMDRRAFFRSLRRRRDCILELRPGSLAIAINGKIAARHTIRGSHNVLSAAVERPEQALFVEVFTEHDIRLAMLSVGPAPPDGLAVQTQDVLLSDSRRLELTLSFDGQGLSCEIAYFDPALAPDAALDLEDLEALEGRVPAVVPAILHNIGPQARELQPRAASTAADAPRNSFYEALLRLVRGLTPQPAAAWALLLALVLCVGGYIAYRNAAPTLEAQQILARSIRVETEDLNGQTLHEVIQFEEVANDQQVLQRGTIQVLRDGDGSREARRLYDSQHRLLASVSRKKNDAESTYWHRNEDRRHDSDLRLASTELLRQDLSARGFDALAGRAGSVKTTADGYEVTTSGPTADHPKLVSATLVLDHALRPVRETVRERRADGIHEARFVRISYERRPARSVPDSEFDLPSGAARTSRGDLLLPKPGEGGGETDVRLAELHIATLYELNTLNADTSDPIEVTPVAGAGIRVSGVVSDDARRQQIRSRLQSLPGHQWLDIHLLSPREARLTTTKSHAGSSQSLKIYDLNPSGSLADPEVRRYLQTQGFSGWKLDREQVQFSRDALALSQHAVQHAYALERLGKAFPPATLGSISPSSKQKWAWMVAEHADALGKQLDALGHQLGELSHTGVHSSEPEDDASAQIEDAGEFAQTAQRLAQQTQAVNLQMGAIFASHADAPSSPDIDAPLNSLRSSLPLQEAARIARFAKKLEVSAGAQP